MEIQIDKTDNFLTLNNSNKVLFEIAISLVITGIIFFIICWEIFTVGDVTFKLMLILVLLFSFVIMLLYVFKTFKITSCNFNNLSNTLEINFRSILKKNITQVSYDDIHNINIKSIETKSDNNSSATYKHDFAYKYSLYIIKKDQEELLLYTFNNKNSANNIAKEVKKFIGVD